MKKFTVLLLAGLLAAGCGGEDSGDSTPVTETPSIADTPAATTTPDQGSTEGDEPTASPTPAMTPEPTTTPVPTLETETPTETPAPTATPAPTMAETPTAEPSETQAPTDDPTATPTPEPTPDYDCDGDGYSVNNPPPSNAAEWECNDFNASVHYGALEVCNGFDDDCDFYTDEGVFDCASASQDMELPLTFGCFYP